MNKLNEPLEAFNGTWAILAVYCVVFIGLHVWDTAGSQPWRRWYLIPLGLQIAIATGVLAVAEVCTRTAVWYWRFSTDGNPARLIDFAIPLATGAVLGIGAFLWLLWVVSRRFGAWPISAAVLTVAAYLSTFIWS